MLLGIKNPLVNWRKDTPTHLKGRGLWACLMGAMIATKLQRSGFVFETSNQVINICTYV